MSASELRAHKDERKEAVAQVGRVRGLPAFVAWRAWLVLFCGAGDVRAW
jgi:hypothetical protein